MTAHGESDDALLLGETTLEVTLAEEKAVDATAHAGALGGRLGPEAEPRQ